MVEQSGFFGYFSHGIGIFINKLSFGCKCRNKSYTLLSLDDNFY